MKRGRIFFNGSPTPSLGVEVELQIFSKDDYSLYPGAPLILEHFQGSMKIKEELLESIIEINTDICKDVSQARSDLTSTISEVNKFVESKNLGLVSMATHPFSSWTDQSITKSERYIHFLDRMQWPLRRLLITGIHVHIGVESGEKAIAVTNGLMRYIPHMIGISANSPFFAGEKTGLASTRTKIFEAMPTAGLPPKLVNYSEFQKFMRTLQKANTIESIREVWWDIRPHPGFGTVEIRVFDSVPTINDIMKLAAFAQTLVVGISDHYDEGTQLDFLDSWIITENKWRATRYGLDADIIVDENGNQQSLKGAIIDTIDKLIPVARELRCADEFESIVDDVENNTSPYTRQIRIEEESGSMEEIVKEFNSNLVSELK